MKILIVYATTEGQTRKIARHAADHLADKGHAVELLPAEDAGEPDLARFDAALLAGSLHAGAYQASLRSFAKANAAGLGALKTLFLSVSLSAAGDNPDDHEGLEKCLEDFVAETGWTPARAHHVAGALRFTEYDFFRYWAMRWIASNRGQKVSGQEDVEFTDWAALESLLDDWAAG